MRLIDADELIEGRVENDPVVIAAKCTPTAYDVDKVVERLKKLEICERCLNRNNAISHCATFCDVGKRLEIVKGGGKDG